METEKDKLEARLTKAALAVAKCQRQIRERDNALAAAVGAVAMTKLRDDPTIRGVVSRLLPSLRPDQQDLLRRKLEQTATSA